MTLLTKSNDASTLLRPTILQSLANNNIQKCPT